MGLDRNYLEMACGRVDDALVVEARIAYRRVSMATNAPEENIFDKFSSKPIRRNVDETGFVVGYVAARQEQDKIDVLITGKVEIDKDHSDLAKYLKLEESRKYDDINPIIIEKDDRFPIKPPASKENPISFEGPFKDPFVIKPKNPFDDESRDPFDKYPF